MQIDIAFSRRVPRPGLLDVSLLLAALVILAGAGWGSYEKLVTAQTLQKSIGAFRNPTEKRSQPISPKQLTEINLAIMQLNLPWSQFLTAIEKNLSSNVALLGIDPNAERQIVRIEGEAKTAGDMIDFVEQLGRDPFFQDASLLRHQINDSDQNHPFRFTMEVSWR
ncbi:MAG: PilN domain-containing protein [Dechloromonas sp.]|nr:PilN domain-containing protein [Dechloromonas sp.]